MLQIKLYEKILKANDYIASDNHNLFKANNVYVVGILGSPGAGKTSVLEQTIISLMNEKKTCAVLVGDLATTRDAERIQQFGIPTAQLTTGGACHLEAQQIQEAVKNFDLETLDFLFIENVGNLVCPSSYYLGEDLRTVVLSVPEGDDKVEKYPATFKKASSIILNKIDFLDKQSFSITKVKKQARLLNPDIPWFEISCVTGQGVEHWVKFLLNKADERRS